MDIQSPSQIINLRGYKRQGRIFKIIGAYDAISSHFASEAGFDGIWASGLCISASYGLPDASILSSTQLLNSVQQIVGASNKPVLVDCDSGYGDVHSVINLLRQLERIGAKGMVIEDKKFPKLNSFSTARSQVLEEPEIFAGKLNAACNYRHNKGFAIIARIEALVAGFSMLEALKRATLYFEAGADAILIHSKCTTPAEVLDFACRWRWHDECPLIVVPTTYPNVEVKTLLEYQVAGIIYANQLLRGIIPQLQNLLENIRDADNIRTIDTSLSSVDSIFAIQNMEEYRVIQKRYQTFGTQSKKKD